MIRGSKIVFISIYHYTVVQTMSKKHSWNLYKDTEDG